MVTITVLNVWKRLTISYEEKTLNTGTGDDAIITDCSRLRMKFQSPNESVRVRFLLLFYIKRHGRSIVTMMSVRALKKILVISKKSLTSEKKPPGREVLSLKTATNN